jgi:sterol desaturase/sphingolipid hydroxylase (fatty acid hydroxylase superfamily)
LWWNIIFDLLILDLWIYAWHRLNHALPFLWRFHEVHHLDENLDTSTGLRFHFGEVALSSIVRAGFIWFLSIPFNTVVVFETLVVITALFQHSNLRIPPQIEAALSKLIITPSRHWVHHHALRQDTDSNYATILSVWDVLFKSRSPNERHMAMQMGVEGVKDENILRLIFRPFWRA